MKLLHCPWHINERSMSKYGGYSADVTDVVSILSYSQNSASKQSEQEKGYSKQSHLDSTFKQNNVPY